MGGVGRPWGAALEQAETWLGERDRKGRGCSLMILFPQGPQTHSVIPSHVTKKTQRGQVTGPRSHRLGQENPGLCGTAWGMVQGKPCVLFPSNRKSPDRSGGSLSWALGWTGVGKQPLPQTRGSRCRWSSQPNKGASGDLRCTVCRTLPGPAGMWPPFLQPSRHESFQEQEGRGTG